jgi:UDP-N-acetylmuramate--alanine ligase
LASGAKIYDDYAHHPTEIRATLAGFREAFPDARITAVFQPHLYSRTKLFMDEFAQSFSDADVVYVADIYAAREKDDGSVHARDLVDTMEGENVSVIYGGSLADIARTLSEVKEFSERDIIITMGAGDVYTVGEILLEEDK